MITPTGDAERNLRNSGLVRIAGVDEAGCGALAGPVVAAAVILPQGHALAVRDSKTLSARQRERLFDEIQAVAVAVNTGIVDATTIDEIGIRPATFLAMRKALSGIGACQHALVDGWKIPDVDLSQTPIIKGDQKEFCIAAASIVAKVTRDRLMIKASALYPEYAFAAHKGYGTAKHQQAVRMHGICPLHRRSFSTCSS
ncbi:ribonuclease HII [Candidatus Uhrbacteria bacterium RIFCSPLOWO2_01_FULL_53_9]|uniref:Ribonuclease HII n=2 Tax=Candidatus Uhriibacteriota TaxID=1752732 RepID=A0A1F7UYE0_9BACT|nr:MAG: ribonuclease HII [Candidatus Uhrbacteria bacterium RIFCSPHIGHO2_02_FULL_53_13]OGL83283.1 MAG: ribonuclease HII [Candidatus Uhrbacteria bacterium RIFCSPLOWO2_01_FULL_53_9]